MNPLKTLELTQQGTYAFEHGGMSIHDPMASECGRFRYDGVSDGFSPAEYGFEVVETGDAGERSAWRQMFSMAGHRDKTVYMLLTDEDAKTHAVKAAQSVRIAVYEVDGTPLCSWLQDEGDVESTPPRLVRSDEQDEVVLSRGSSAALDEACRLIQDHLGIKHGDFASVYWTGKNESDFREMLRAYMDAERADVAALKAQQ